MSYMNAKQHYKVLYREARLLLQKADERGEGEGVKRYKTAHTLTDCALDRLSQCHWAYMTDAPRFDAVACCGKVFDAVNWAMHWKHFPVIRDDVPLGMSERHLAFEMGPNGTRTWYSRNLPA